MAQLLEHPDFEQLSRFLDQEMATRSSRAVEKHIAGCWKCRAQVDEIQSTIRDFARYHEKVLVPRLPVPSRWADLRTEMARVDATELETAPAGIGSMVRLILGGGALACVVLAVTLTYGTGGAAKKAAPAVSKEAKGAPAVSSTVEPVAPKSRPRADVPGIPREISNPISDEVLVFAALHNIGADLGDPISVTVEAGRVRLIGVGLAASREAEIREAVASVPGIQIDFQQGQTSRASASRSVSVAAAKSPFEEKLLPWAGGQDGWERYANRVLDESDAILARSHALRTLALEFPAARRAGLDESAAAQLSEIADSHRASLDRHIAAIEALLVPVQEALNAPVAVTPPGGRDLLPAAQRLDRVVSVVFGGAATNLKPTQLLAELSNAIAELKNAGRDE